MCFFFTLFHFPPSFFLRTNHVVLQGLMAECNTTYTVQVLFFCFLLFHFLRALFFLKGFLFSFVQSCYGVLSTLLYYDSAKPLVGWVGGTAGGMDGWMYSTAMEMELVCP